VYGHFQVVRVDGHRFEQLLDEDSSLVVSGGFPDALEFELLEGCEHVLESASEFFLGGDCHFDLGLLGSNGGDLVSEVLFLGGEQLAGDAVVVVELQELASSFGEVTKCLRRALTVPAGALAGTASRAPSSSRRMALCRSSSDPMRRSPSSAARSSPLLDLRGWAHPSPRCAHLYIV
jgi:hypothetical protein